MLCVLQESGLLPQACNRVCMCGTRAALVEPVMILIRQHQDHPGRAAVITAACNLLDAACGLGLLVGAEDPLLRALLLGLLTPAQWPQTPYDMANAKQTGTELGAASQTGADCVLRLQLHLRRDAEDVARLSRSWERGGMPGGAFREGMRSRWGTPRGIGEGALKPLVGTGIFPSRSEGQLWPPMAPAASQQAQVAGDAPSWPAPRTGCHT